jgi:hypothetical protein
MQMNSVSELAEIINQKIKTIEAEICMDEAIEIIEYKERRIIAIQDGWRIWRKEFERGEVTLHQIQSKIIEL